MRTTDHPLATVAVAVLLPLGTLATLAGGSLPLAVAGVAVVVMALWLGQRNIAGLWRHMRAGLAAGAVAGLLVLGPGLRTAMRVVAMMDPVRRPDFTLEGTLFVILFAGLFMGAVFGPSLSLLAAFLPESVTGVVFAVTGLALLTIDPQLRTELVHLGGGAVFNAPLFGLVFWVHAKLTLRARRRSLASRAPTDLVDLTTAV